MKRVVGRPLDGIVREAGPLEERLALLPKVLAVAEALAYAHEQGIIHRDFKPANVLVGSFGETTLALLGNAEDLASGRGSVALRREQAEVLEVSADGVLIAHEGEGVAWQIGSMVRAAVSPASRRRPVATLQ